jgi:CCR4-NOT transcription complex subunit 6
MGGESARSVDGCATFWNREVFSLVRQEVVEYQTLGLRKHDILGQTGMNRLITKDNIALAVLLRPNLSTGLRINPQAETDQILVVNTHIHWDPSFCDVKLMQVGLMLEQLESIVAQNSPQGDPAGPGALPVIIAGDFNSVVDSAVYDLLSQRRVPAGHRDFNGYDYGKYSNLGMRHSLEVSSAYASVLGREPAFTNYTGDFVGTLDYIWASANSVVPVRVLLTLPEEIVVSHNGALPNPFMCSDHLPLVADFQPRHLLQPPNR